MRGREGEEWGGGGSEGERGEEWEGGGSEGERGEEWEGGGSEGERTKLVDIQRREGRKITEKDKLFAELNSGLRLDTQ